MKKNLQLICIGLFASFTIVSCTKEAETLIIDSSLPQGAFVVEKSGTFIDQNAAGSMGTAQLGSDEDGKQFLKFGSDFSTGLATGTVTVYFSTSMTFTADPGAGNPDLRLMGIVQDTGEMYFLIDPVLGEAFTHVILWCGTANIPFGYAALN